MKFTQGQCFDCYDNATFQYIGQTGEFNPNQVQLDYVSRLTKPITVVECITCTKIVEYTEQDGKWKTLIK